MISYNTGTIGICFIWQLRGSVFPKALVWALPAAALTVFLHSLKNYTDAERDQIAGLGMEGVQQLWAGYTMMIAFLITFRNNLAYNRYWEGATLIMQMKGEWINAVSSLFSFCSHEEEVKPQVDQFQHLLVRLMSMLHCQALQSICDLEDDALEVIDVSDLDPHSLTFLSTQTDRCEVLYLWVQRVIVEATAGGIITVAPPVFTRAFQELSRGMVKLGNVRKIRDVPFPFPYDQILQMALMVHALVTPWITAFECDDPIWAGCVSFFTVGALWSVVYVAREIDSPFGDDANDFDLHEMQKLMNHSLLTLMQPMAQRPPEILRPSGLTLAPSDTHVVSRRIAERTGGFLNLRDNRVMSSLLSRQASILGGLSRQGSMFSAGPGSSRSTLNRSSSLSRFSARSGADSPKVTGSMAAYLEEAASHSAPGRDSASCAAATCTSPQRKKDSLGEGWHSQHGLALQAIRSENTREEGVSSSRPKESQVGKNHSGVDSAATVDYSQEVEYCAV